MDGWRWHGNRGRRCHGNGAAGDVPGNAVGGDRWRWHGKEAGGGVTARGWMLLAERWVAGDVMAVGLATMSRQRAGGGLMAMGQMIMPRQWSRNDCISAFSVSSCCSPRFGTNRSSECDCMIPTTPFSHTRSCASYCERYLS